MPFFVYLIRSTTSPRPTAYIGYTKTPRKRLRQHNGELVNGAWQTHKHRPWEHVCIISGFPNGIVALQFEWQWQHGTRKTLGAVEYTKRQKSMGCVLLLAKLKDLLVTPLWSRLDLTVHFLEPDHMNQFEAIRADAMTACSRLIPRAEIDTMHQVPQPGQPCSLPHSNLEPYSSLPITTHVSTHPSPQPLDTVHHATRTRH